MAKKIMIVDDSRTIRQQVCDALTRHGFEVVEANDGNEGLAQLKAHPDLAMIISDVNMPNMDGLEMLEKIRAASNPITVVMLTTEGASDLISRAKAAGAKAWLVKPFEPDQLVKTVIKLAA